MGKHITYCIYCRIQQKDIRKENKKAGYRIPCYTRGTKKGFHSFARREIVDDVQAHEGKKQ